MEYTAQSGLGVKPRLIIHGGAGNIPTRENYPPEKYAIYRSALLSIITRSREYMLSSVQPEKRDIFGHQFRSAIDIAAYAVTLLENNPLFNCARGAVFTRDGINQLEASIMVSRGKAKRGVGVMGLRRVKNPILLAKGMLIAGEDDLAPRGRVASALIDGSESVRLDVPSAQGHTQIYGEAAEQLAVDYGLEMVDPSYFFTQQRWDEHVRALEKENSAAQAGAHSATWSPDEYLPQGTVGAVALDSDGVLCTATSTGGMTNKLTGRVGDTPVPGAGFWAEEWEEGGDTTVKSAFRMMKDTMLGTGTEVEILGPLKGFLADCLPTPWMYQPFHSHDNTITTRSIAGSGTGNGDSFLRICALRTLCALARWKPLSGSAATAAISGPGGELQKSAGSRWKRTGEGEGGIIGIECVIVRNGNGRVTDVQSDLLMNYNCGGMYRAWIDEKGDAKMSIWTNGAEDQFP